MFWSEDDRFCVLATWEDFEMDPEGYINRAFSKREHPNRRKNKSLPIITLITRFNSYGSTKILSGAVISVATGVSKTIPGKILQSVKGKNGCAIIPSR